MLTELPDAHLLEGCWGVCVYWGAIVHYFGVGGFSPAAFAQAPDLQSLRLFGCFCRPSSFADQGPKSPTDPVPKSSADPKSCADHGPKSMSA